MTTKKTTTKATTEKKTATKSTAAKKSTTTKKAATAKTATKVAEKTAVATAPAITEKLVATIVPETPETQVEMEAVVAKAAEKAVDAPKAEIVTAEKKIVLTIGMFQKRLTDLGFYTGNWDGVYGPMTKHAVARFQAKNGLAVNGDANPETLKALGLDLYKTY